MKTTMQEAQALPKTVAISADVVSYVQENIVEALPEAKTTWYTTKEIKLLQLQTYREALRLSRVVSLAPAESVTNDQRLQCLGIESWTGIDTDPDIAAQVRQGRQHHVRLILQAQHVCTEEDLSMISKRSSASTCQRAYFLANRHLE